MLHRVSPNPLHGNLAPLLAEEPHLANNNNNIFPTLLTQQNGGWLRKVSQKDELNNIQNLPIPDHKMSEKLLKTFEALRGHYNQVNAANQQAAMSGESSPVSQRRVSALFS